MESVFETAAVLKHAYLLPALSVEEIRGSQTVDISARGLLSLDAESTQSAKKQLKSAVKLGYETILQRVTKDVGFALRSTERGLTRSAMLIQDAIATVLPKPGRSTEQRTMGVGSQGSMAYGAGSTAATTARLLYLRADRCPSQGEPHHLHGGLFNCNFVAWSCLLPE